jgi:[ribosomal protein S5]-alanine N-acetyltransferase
VIATLQTKRLFLQPLQLADAERTQRLFPQWEMVTFLNKQIPWPYPADGAFTYYRDVALPRSSAESSGTGPYDCGNRRKNISDPSA